MMKKIFRIIAILFLLIVTLSGCKKETLQTPVYPLDTATVNTALEQVGLPWVIAKEESWMENQTVYTLNNADDKMVAVILSGAVTDGHLLNMSFMSSYHNQWDISRSVPQEDIQKVIHLATILYGGFDDSQHLYENYTKTSDSKTEVVESNGAPENIAFQHAWKNKVNGITCCIRFSEADSDPDSKDIRQLILYNSEEFSDVGW